MGYERAYSPVPPPCPSPQLKPMPLPIPPVYPRRRSISSSSSSPSQIQSHRLKIARLTAEVSTESFVSSLQDVIVVGSPSKHRHSEFSSSEASSSRNRLDRPLSIKSQMAQSQSCIDLPFPTSPTAEQHRRRSECPPGHHNALSSPGRRSSSKTRTWSPSRRPHTAQDLPPVPPLPPAKPDYNPKSFISKKLAPIRIPELGLGLDEKLRSPLSPNASSCHWRRRGREREAKEETSFLDLSPRREQKRLPIIDISQTRSSSSVRPTPSLPERKSLKRRSSSLADRILKFGMPQAVH